MSTLLASIRSVAPNIRIIEVRGRDAALQHAGQAHGADAHLLTGEVLESNGQELVLKIKVTDASGHQWYEETYRQKAEGAAYKDNIPWEQDAYQDLYNTIANDLAEVRAELEAADTKTIRRVAALRFAADLAPDAFTGYLREDDGKFSVVRLPAADDPMYRRVQAIRDRDLLLIDTLNGHFGNFTRQMERPYTEWRRARSEEAAALRDQITEIKQQTFLSSA